MPVTATPACSSYSKPILLSRMTLLFVRSNRKRIVRGAANRAKVVELVHDRSRCGIGLGNTGIDITFATRGGSHVAELEYTSLDRGLGDSRSRYS